ncbi:hypothetical protein XU18_1281 [Perkinsela sp. CCAP 1560/4]|nr:hypothetical protein XU18_1281 [Perkinsela sp. CCAP 1560/4]|eukprot:KNH08168.1 hypothetical protein XU18_1281 [Perkinsela sp. CCAP 1560/4]
MSGSGVPIETTDEAKSFWRLPSVIENTTRRWEEALSFVQNSQESSNSQVKTQPDEALQTRRVAASSGENSQSTTVIYGDTHLGIVAELTVIDKQFQGRHETNPQITSWAQENTLPTSVEILRRSSMANLKNKSTTCELTPSIEISANVASTQRHPSGWQCDAQPALQSPGAHSGLPAIHAFESRPSRGLFTGGNDSEEYSETDEAPNGDVVEAENTSVIFPMEAAILQDEYTQFQPEDTAVEKSRTTGGFSAAAEVVIQSEETTLTPTSIHIHQTETYTQPTTVDISGSLPDSQSSTFTSVPLTASKISADLTETQTRLPHESHDGGISKQFCRLIRRMVPSLNSTAIREESTRGKDHPGISERIVAYLGIKNPVKQMKIADTVEPEENPFRRLTRGRDIVLRPDDATVLRWLKKSKAYKRKTKPVSSNGVLESDSVAEDLGIQTPMKQMKNTSESEGNPYRRVTRGGDFFLRSDNAMVLRSLGETTGEKTDPMPASSDRLLVSQRKINPPSGKKKTDAKAVQKGGTSTTSPKSVAPKFPLPASSKSTKPTKNTTRGPVKQPKKPSVRKATTVQAKPSKAPAKRLMTHTQSQKKPPAKRPKK